VISLGVEADADNYADVLLNYVEGMRVDASSANKIIPFAVEAAWATTRWDTLSKYAERFNGDMLEDVNVSLAALFGALKRGPSGQHDFAQTLHSMREKLGSAMTHSATSSLQTSHELRLRCHVLTDLEMIASTRETEGPAHQAVLTSLERRLEILGAYVHDKQFLLGIRRAGMELVRSVIPNLCERQRLTVWQAHVQ
jgi:serine/threonine-protein kinase ATR